MASGVAGFRDEAAWETRTVCMHLWRKRSTLGTGTGTGLGTGAGRGNRSRTSRRPSFWTFDISIDVRQDNRVREGREQRVPVCQLQARQTTRGESHW